MRANLEAFRAGASSRACCATSRPATSRPRCSARRCRRPVLLAPVGVQKLLHDEGELATARAAAALGPAAHRLDRLVDLDGGHRRGGRRRGAALVPALLAERPRARREPRPPRRGERALRDRPHRRQLDRRLEAPRPPAGLPPLPRGDRDRAVPVRPRLPRRASRRRPRRTSVAAVGHFLGVFSNPSLTWDDLEWLAEVTSLPIVLKGVLHPDDAARGARARHGRRRRLEPRRPPDRRRDRLARRPAGDRRRGRRRDRGPARQRRPLGRRRVQGARARRRRGADRPPLPLGPGARRARRASRPCCAASSPSST